MKTVRLLALVGAGCVLGSVPAAAHTTFPSFLRDTLEAPAAAERDTTAAIRFHIPAQPLADALREFSRRAGVRVELDVRAAAGADRKSVG
jgi:hypothetical protein